MRKDILIQLNKLAVRVLDSKRPADERSAKFSEMFNLFWKYKKSYKEWAETYNKLRDKHLRELTKTQLKKYSLSKADLKKSFINLRKESKAFGNIPKLDKFCVSYSSTYSLIKKLASPRAEIFEIGYGEYPFLINILNNEGFDCKGIEPTVKKANNRTTFKAKIQNLPKKLGKKYDLVIAVLVFSAHYMHFFKKRFIWERENKKEILNTLAKVVKPRGYLILEDDIGSIFTKKELSKKFKIIFFEKDIPLLEFNKNINHHGFFRLTLLKKE